MDLFNQPLEHTQQAILSNEWTPSECLAWAMDHSSIVRGMLHEDNREPDATFEKCIALLVVQHLLAKREQEAPAKLAKPKRVEEYPALPFQSARFAAAWDAWEVERKEQKRKKYTPRGMRLQFKEFETMGEERAIAAIYYSIKNNYQGIHEPSSSAAMSQAKPNHAAQTLTAAAEAIAKRERTA